MRWRRCAGARGTTSQAQRRAKPLVARLLGRDSAAKRLGRRQEHDVETWKRLLTAAWLRARGESDADMLPALDGRGVDVIYRKTSKLNRAEFSELCEFVFAWAAQNGIEFEGTP